MTVNFAEGKERAAFVNVISDFDPHLFFPMSLMWTV